MSESSYLRFVQANRRFLAFGFTMTFCSSAGQTYFIGAFGPAVRAEFGLSHTAWSTIYMAGTLASATLLPWSGQLIDRVSLRRYAIGVALLLIFAASFMALVPSALLLVVAIFLLRQSGQGLASHTGTTAMARGFSGDRGKAVALASLGFAAGETLLPFLAVLAIAAIGWRATYGATSLALACFLLPLIWWLLPGGGQLSSDPAGSAEASQESSWTRGQVLRDARFYLLLPAIVAPSFIGTALFFHHLALAEVKGWGAAWITGSYWIYALGSVFAALAAGPLIDRITAVRVLPAYLLPMALGLMIVWGTDARLWAWPYLLLVGLSSGVSYTAVTVLWAEIYGVRHLGAIRSLVVALSVFSSALGPVTMGALMDGGVSVEAICALFAIYCLLATGLMTIALKTLR
ncbi:MAG: MFS transporter [Pseudomonadota bacterium]